MTPAWRPPEIEFCVTEGGTGRPLVLLHGFTGAAASWLEHFDSFAGRHRVIAPDLPGHGGTAETSALDGMTVEATADALARFLAERGAVPAAVLGYSFGARIALRLAIEHPAAVGRLILESPSAGIADRADRAARRVDDEALAERLEHDGVADFVTAWEHNPVFASHAAANPQLLARQRAIRLTSRPAGLAASLRAAGQGSMQPLHARLGEVTAPTLVITGALDAVGRPRAELVANGIAGSRLEILEDVGHTPHLESPDAFRRLVLDFTQEDRRRMTSPVTWTPVVEYRDIRYEHSGTGIAKVTINRPEVRNAFRPQTVRELIDAFARIRDDASVGCVLLTGEGDKAFCSGGDQQYKSHEGGYLDTDGIARLNVLDLQRQIRSLPIPVIALVNGYAIGGGHVLHIVCDMSIASDNAIFGQVGPRVGSFDAGFGVGLLARLVGDKKAKEIWFLCRQYSADEALAMNLVNKVVPLADLEAEGVAWAGEILDMSPTAIRFLKSAFLVATDGLAGLQEFAGNTTGLYYTTDEAHEGSTAFLEKRKPDYRKYPRRP